MLLLEQSPGFSPNIFVRSRTIDDSVILNHLHIVNYRIVKIVSSSLLLEIKGLWARKYWRKFLPFYKFSNMYISLLENEACAWGHSHGRRLLYVEIVTWQKVFVSVSTHMDEDFVLTCQKCGETHTGESFRNFFALIGYNFKLNYKLGIRIRAFFNGLRHQWTVRGDTHTGNGLCKWKHSHGKRFLWVFTHMDVNSMSRKTHMCEDFVLTWAGVIGK